MPVFDPTAYSPETITHLDVGLFHWRAVGLTVGAPDNRSLLCATVQIAGVDHHLTAVEVLTVAGQQIGAEGVEELYDDIVGFAGLDGPFEEVSIEGRRYVLGMCPFEV